MSTAALTGLDRSAKLVRASLKGLPTFRENKSVPIHGWFSYTEGYSFDLVRRILESLPYGPKKILDPFSGSGTTGVESVLAGIDYQGYDINPAMRSIAIAKTQSALHVARLLRKGKISFQDLQDELHIVLNHKPRADEGCKLFKGQKYFSRRNLKAINVIRQNIYDIEDPNIRNLFLAGLLSILVKVSILKRSPDLKYRAVADRNRPCPFREFHALMQRILTDLTLLDIANIGTAKNYLQSAKKLQYTPCDSIDLIITSPPYLNGTNYIRNTKLELWTGGYVYSDSDIKNLRVKMISCSINSAQNTRVQLTDWPLVNRTIKRIASSAYDKRIAPMVSHYFLDMSQALSEMHRVLQKGKRAFLVIGDSAFNGVHVPTHKHLVTIANDMGLKKIKSLKLRDRRSRSGQPLTEDIIELQRV